MANEIAFMKITPLFGRPTFAGYLSPLGRSARLICLKHGRTRRSLGSRTMLHLFRYGIGEPPSRGIFLRPKVDPRLTNEDVVDLFSCVDVDTRVAVLAKNSPHLEAKVMQAKGTIAVRPRSSAIAARCDDAGSWTPIDTTFLFSALLATSPQFGFEVAGSEQNGQKW
jgi:hypothetical protein